MSDPRFAGYVDHYTATIPWAHHPYRRVLVSHNELLEDYPWAYGVKTGWTDPAGYCIVAAGQWRGHDILVTLLGEPDDAHRLADALKLFHWSASQYAVRTAWPSGTVLAHADVPVALGKLDLVPAGAHHRLAAHRRQVTSRVVAPARSRCRSRRARPSGRRRPTSTVTRSAPCGWSRPRRSHASGCSARSATRSTTPALARPSRL